MLRFLTLGLFAAVLAVPAPASACDGPFSRLRTRLQARFAPAPCAPCQQAAPAPQTAAPAPKVVQGAQPKVVEGLFEGRLRERARCEILRVLAIQHAVEHGVPNGDGTTRKVTRAEARKLADQLTDEVILKAGKTYGAPVAGEGRLEAFFNWIIEHKDEIAELVKFLAGLFALFASSDDPVKQAWALEFYEIALPLLRTLGLAV